jgi:predicted dehydrogenase
MSFGFGWHAWPDPPIGPNIESRLRDQIWLSDTGLSGDTIVSYDIHIIDGLMAVLGRRPVSASGRSLTCRPKPNGDRTDAAAVVYEFEDGAPWTHVTQALDNQFDVTTLSAKIFGMKATAHIQYAGKVYVRGGDKHYVGNVGNVFNEGVERNIASFYTNITENHFENPTVQRAVDGHLTAILGREAAARRKYLTMDELVKENKKLVVNLEGLKT